MKEDKVTGNEAETDKADKQEPIKEETKKKVEPKKE